MFNFLTHVHMIWDYTFTTTKAMAFHAITQITTTVITYFGETKLLVGFYIAIDKSINQLGLYQQYVHCQFVMQW